VSQTFACLCASSKNYTHGPISLSRQQTVGTHGGCPAALADQFSQIRGRTGTDGIALPLQCTSRLFRAGLPPTQTPLSSSMLTRCKTRVEEALDQGVIPKSLEEEISRGGGRLCRPEPDKRLTSAPPVRVASKKTCCRSHTSSLSSKSNLRLFMSKPYGSGQVHGTPSRTHS
jgi:hypothetical protein